MHTVCSLRHLNEIITNKKPSVAGILKTLKTRLTQVLILAVQREAQTFYDSWQS